MNSPALESINRPYLLKMIREKLYGFTQEDMAITLGVDKNTIARWERGERRLSKQVIRHIEHLLLCDRTDREVKAYLSLWTFRPEEDDDD